MKEILTQDLIKMQSLINTMSLLVKKSKKEILKISTIESFLNPYTEF